MLLLILLLVFLYFALKKTLYDWFYNVEKKCLKLADEYSRIFNETEELRSENAKIDYEVNDQIALYDITRDICKTLDEGKIFTILRTSLDRFLKVSECRFIKSEVELSSYKGYTSLPLTIDKNTVGYLVASGIDIRDIEEFNILAQQFLFGIKRAFLYKEVQETAITDSLTQVCSRRYFLERFSEELLRSSKFKLHLTFVMIDVDNFKSFNDQYGHLVGDAILREVARVIKETIRSMDFIGRYGGEELCIVLAETDKDQALLAAERIRQAVEGRSIRVYDEVMKVTISIGLSTYPKDAQTDKSLIEKADKALYKAKLSGKNKVCSA
jgi:diguanylate cyclase (GGDEF)-like protein